MHGRADNKKVAATCTTRSDINVKSLKRGGYRQIHRSARTRTHYSSTRITHSSAEGSVQMKRTGSKNGSTLKRGWLPA
jgi:hypothetical protein